MLCGFVFASQVMADDFFTASDFENYNIDLYDGVNDNKANYVLAAENIKTNFGLDKNGNIGQSTVIDCPNMTKDQIYVQAVMWYQKLFGKKVQCQEIMNDRATGTLVVERVLEDIAKDRKWNAWKGFEGAYVNILARISLEIKDGKCRLTTTIKDYGIGTIKTNAYGMKFKSKKTKACPPKDNFPFELQLPAGMKKGDVKDAQKEYKKNTSIAAKAYVMSYIYTQVIHDKLSNFLMDNSAAGTTEDW